jgi:hypothetical protein
MKRTPGKTTAAKEKYWEKIIEAARRYPQGITQYCRVMNVKKTTISGLEGFASNTLSGTIFQIVQR